MRTAFTLLVALALPSAATAGCPGKFASLTKYAGESPDRFLQEPTIKSRMRALMGSDVNRLETDLAVRASVGLINCELVVEGNAAHQGGERSAILSFNVNSGQMTVGMLEQGRVIIISPTFTGKSYSHLPAHVRDWALVATDGFRSRINPPANVEIVSSFQDR